jgi:SOS response regulatory protein OraA/RecX
MYTVIICPNCEFPQIVADDPKRTDCQRCRDGLKFRKLKRFFTSSSLDEAQYARGTIAAQQRGVDDVDELPHNLDTEGVSDRLETELFEANNMNKADIEDQASTSSSINRSPPELLKDAIRSLDEPTEQQILEYTTEHGLSRDRATQVLSKLERHAEVMRPDGSYRLI